MPALPGWSPLRPSPPPPYLVGFELGSGHIVHAAAAESLVWGQVQFIQIMATMRATGGQGVLVLVDTASGQVRERVIVTPTGPPEFI